MTQSQTLIYLWPDNTYILASEYDPTEFAFMGDDFQRIDINDPKAFAVLPEFLRQELAVFRDPEPSTITFRYETEAMSIMRQQLGTKGFTDSQIDTFRSCLTALESIGFTLMGPVL